MKHRCLFKIIASLILVALLFPVTTAYMESSQQIRIPRVISVVYDDSGSMTNEDRDTYTEYAMKVFISLLDKNDVLYITMMSRPDTAVLVDLSMGPEAACNQLDRMIQSGITPEKAILTAQNALLNHKSADSSALYWLVVFTDGYFSGDNAQQYLSSFLNKTMPNGTTPQVCYMGIGKSAPVYEFSNPDYTLYPKSGDIANEDEIIHALRDMADDISSRSIVAEQNIQLSGNIMSVTTTLPSYSIVVLQMRTDIPIKSVTDVSGMKIPVESHQIVVADSSVSSSGTSEQQILKGVTGILRPADGQPMPSGTYTIEFADTPTDVVILTEPALVLDLEVSATDSGKTDDFSLLNCGSANIQAKLHLWNDTTPLDQTLLPEGTMYSTRLEQNGETIVEDCTSLMQLENVDISSSDSEVIAEVNLPGIGRVSSRKSIKLPSIELSTDKTTMKTSLREYCAGMDGFTINLQSAQEIGKVLAADTKLELKSELPLAWRKNEDNTYTIYSSEQTLAPLANYGDYQVTITTDSNVDMEPLQLTWHVTEPEFSISGGIAGLDQLSRLDMLGQKETALGLTLLKDEESLVPENQIYAVFQLLMDGEVLTTDQLNTFGGLTLTYSGEVSNDYPLVQTLLDNGKLVAVPYDGGFDLIDPSLWNWLRSWKGATGDGIITCSNENVEDMTATFHVAKEELWIFLLNVLLPVLLVLLVIGYTCKKRFPRNSYIVIQQVNHTPSGSVSSSNAGETLKLRRMNIWSFIPFVKARIKVRGIPIYPISNTVVGVKKSLLAKNSYLASAKTSNQRGIITVAEQEHSVRKVFHTSTVAEEGTLVPLTIADVLIISGDGRSGTALVLKVNK